MWLGAGAHYLPTLKSGEQIAREKDTTATRAGPSTEIAAKRERTTDETERSADKEVKRRKCPPTSGKRQKERKNECEGPAAGNGGEEENKILNRDISRKRRGKNARESAGEGERGTKDVQRRLSNETR